MAFTMRLPRELERRLSEIAKERGMNRADLIEVILREWVAAHKVDLAPLFHLHQGGKQ